MLARVIENGEFSKVFAVSNGMKQGCVLDPTLFSVMFSAVLTNSFCDSTNVIRIKIKYCLDDKQMTSPQEKILENMMLDFLFADNWTSIGSTAEEMQNSL